MSPDAVGLKAFNLVPVDRGAALQLVPRPTADNIHHQSLNELVPRARAMTSKRKKVPTKLAPAQLAKPRKAAPKLQSGKGAKPILLSGGNPQIAKGDGDAPVQAYVAAMPGWKRDVGRRLDALVTRTVPGVRKAVKWNSPFYGVEGQRGRLVPQLSLLHEVCEGGFLPRHVAASCPARRSPSTRKCATSTSMRTTSSTKRSSSRG